MLQKLIHSITLALLCNPTNLNAMIFAKLNTIIDAMINKEYSTGISRYDATLNVVHRVEIMEALFHPEYDSTSIDKDFASCIIGMPGVNKWVPESKLKYSEHFDWAIARLNDSAHKKLIACHVTRAIAMLDPTDITTADTSHADTFLAKQLLKVEYRTDKMALYFAQCIQCAHNTWGSETLRELACVN